MTDSKGAKALLSIKTLNEFDSKIAGVDCRKQIETQRGAVIATELKNNANKLAKWTYEALLAGADQLKLGFVSRTHPKDPTTALSTRRRTSPRISRSRLTSPRATCGGCSSPWWTCA